MTSTPASLPSRRWLEPGNWSVKAKLLFSLLLVAVLPLIALGGLSSMRTREALVRDAQTALLSTTRSTASAIDHVNSERMRAAGLVASDRTIRSGLADPTAPESQALVRQALMEFLGSNSGYTAVFVLDRTGLVPFAPERAIEGEKLSFRPYFPAAMRGELFTSDLTVSASSGKPSIYYSAPVRVGDEVVGAAVIRTNGQEIFDLIADDTSAVGDGTSGMLLDEHGVRLFDAAGADLQFKALVRPTDEAARQIADAKQFGNRPLEVTDEPDLARGISTLATQPVFDTHDGGVTWSAAAVGLASKTWTYVVHTPQAALLAPADRITSATVLLIGLASVVAAALALGLGLSIARPIGRLVGEAERLAAGDVLGDSGDRAAGRDEIGQLRLAFAAVRAYLRDIAGAAECVAAGDLTVAVTPRSEHDVLAASLNRMVDGLRDVVAMVDLSATDVADSSRQFHAATAQSGATVQQVSQAIQSVAGGAQDSSSAAQETNASVGELGNAIAAIARGVAEQAARVDTTRSTADRMTAEMDAVAARAAEVAEASEQAKQIARDGGQAVRETTAVMTDIQDVVGRASSRVEDLGCLGQRIGAVVETIDDIAEQTNLLALNAAIEAARAGEHGRGCAVVADEVRKLAERSSRETKQISELIQQVQAGTDAAVSAMHMGAAKVEEGSDKARVAGQAL